MDLLGAIPFLGKLAGWKGCAVAAAAALLLGGWLGWEARDLLADRAALRQAQAVIDAQRQTIDDMAAEAAASSAAVAAAKAAAQKANERVRALEKELASHADQDCTAGPDLQRSLDGLR